MHKMTSISDFVTRRATVCLRRFCLRHRFFYGGTTPQFTTNDENLNLIWKRIQALRWMRMQRRRKSRPVDMWSHPCALLRRQAE